MGNVSKNMSRSEFACECGCGFDSMDVETVNVVQKMCDDFATILEKEKVTLAINSACRCPARNEKIGGHPNSYHMKARALDLRIFEVEADLVADYLEREYPDKYGIGRYDGRTHLDTQAKCKRWDLRSKPEEK